MSLRELPGVKARVVQLKYLPSLQASEQRPHPFVYFIEISNHGSQEIQVLGRKWVLRDQSRETLVVEGEGVVGESPVILPEDSFSYNSYHTIASRTEVQGSFLGQTYGGEYFAILLEPFVLDLPDLG